VVKEERRNERSKAKNQKVFNPQEKEPLKTEYLNSWGYSIHPDFGKVYDGKDCQQH